MSSEESHLPQRQRLEGTERRKLIVEAGFELLSTRGFEGFRTRDVAERSGITTATLHHYFPTKENLIEGVAAYLEELYAKERAPVVKKRHGELSSLRELRQELADARFLRQQKPEMLAVSCEFALRAGRDKTIRALIDRLTGRWCGQVRGILAAGKADGAFRAEIDPEAAAGVIVSALWGGTALLGMDDAEFERLCNQLVRSLSSEKQRGRRSK